MMPDRGYKYIEFISIEKIIYKMKDCCLENNYFKKVFSYY